MRKKTHEEFVEEVGDRPFIVVGEYTTNREKILFSCNICRNEWSAAPRNMLGGE